MRETLCFSRIIREVEPNTTKAYPLPIKASRMWMESLSAGRILSYGQEIRVRLIT